jgi:high-affinity K+ transport system ATPase subunit B
MLLVAEGSSDTPLDDPQGLIALGFVGISDPLRPTVQAAVRRCHEAGVCVIMITGDHPATARTIARETGLLNSGGEVITATEIAELQNDELDARLEQAVVIARATPLDKLRIIESLQRHGRTVAMTGDGVNDNPKALTSRSCWCRIEHMYEMERFSVSQHGGAVRASWLSARPVRLQVGREKPARGTPRPRLAGQARRRMSLHARWWGYRWSNGARSNPHALSDMT